MLQTRSDFLTFALYRLYRVDLRKIGVGESVIGIEMLQQQNKKYYFNNLEYLMMIIDVGIIIYKITS